MTEQAGDHVCDSTCRWQPTRGGGAVLVHGPVISGVAADADGSQAGPDSGAVTGSER